MAAPLSRKQLSIPGLLGEARRCFAKIPDDAGGDMPWVDHLLSRLAVFGLKYPSLLQFDQDRSVETPRANLKTRYGIARARRYPPAGTP
ncbi:MAG: hypothetical protein WAT36_08020 [Chromatiaceae bacterium]